MKSFPIMEIIGNSIKAVVKTFDDIYNAGWLLYFVIGLVVFVLFIIFYN